MSSNFTFTDLWPYLLSILTLVVLPFLVSGNKPTGAVTLINWLKVLLKIKGTAVYIIVFIVSIILTGIIALVDGAIGLTGPMTPERFNIILGIIVVGSQVWYGRLKNEGEFVSSTIESVSIKLDQ